MKSTSFIVKTTMDRIATTEETRDAMEPFHNQISTSGNEIPMEIPSDLGGHIRISAEEFELLYLIGELNLHEK